MESDMTAPKGSEGLVEKLEEIAAEDAMIHTLPWPQIKHALSQAAQRIKELEAEVARAERIISGVAQEAKASITDADRQWALETAAGIPALNQQEPGNDPD